MHTIKPSKNYFLDVVQAGNLLPLSAELDLPGLTPLSALEAIRGEGYPVLLESARVNDKIGRYSFVTAEPYLIFRSRGDDVELSLPVTPTGKYGRRADRKSVV
jgi:anthranilate synthase component 1